jgi:hypothetical protein
LFSFLNATVDFCSSLLPLLSLLDTLVPSPDAKRKGAMLLAEAIVADVDDTEVATEDDVVVTEDAGMEISRLELDASSCSSSASSTPLETLLLAGN